MKRIFVLVGCLLLLLGSTNVSAKEGTKKIDYNDPQFQATVSMLSMDGHASDDYATCSVKQTYYKDVANMMFKKGMTKQQILDYYVKELGVQALQAPPEKGFYLTLWVLPFLLLLIVFLFLYFIVKKWKSNNSTSANYEDPKLEEIEDDFYLQFIEEERKKFI